MNNYKINPKYDKIVRTLSKVFDIGENDVKDAITRSYIVDTDETNDRLRRVFCKASRGDALTIVGLGGSITEGAHAKSWGAAGNNAREFTEQLGGEKCWFERTINWFEGTFPYTTINGYNAGIGATSSFLGAFRLEQMVLQHKPDLVLVEFSVNDLTSTPFLLKNEILETYESIVRRCLEKGIAVMQIFFAKQQSDSMQDLHSEIANHYNVPAISYRDAIFPDSKPICDWERLSPDDVHPNNAGHAFLGTCIANYLDLVYETTDLDAEYQTDELHTSWIYFDSFNKIHAQYAYEFSDKARGGFEFCENIPDVSCKWRGALVSNNAEGSVKLTVSKGAKRVYIQYFNADGSFQTEFIGQQSVCNTSPIGWPRACWHRVYTGSAISEDSTIMIKSHQSGKVILMGLLVTF